jgi:hypothetical protein
VAVFVAPPYTVSEASLAELFAAPDGYFASGPRGKVAGREKLVALVRSERHCTDSSERRATNAPTVPVGCSGSAT